MATWKQIEASRERRLWVTQVIMPTISFGVIAMSVPEFRETVASAVGKAKTSIKNKFKKY